MLAAALVQLITVQLVGHRLETLEELIHLPCHPTFLLVQGKILSSDIVLLESFYNFDCDYSTCDNVLPILNCDTASHTSVPVSY